MRVLIFYAITILLLPGLSATACASAEEQRPASLYYAEGYELFQGKRYREAADKFKQAYRQLPSNEKIQHALAVTLITKQSGDSLNNANALINLWNKTPKHVDTISSRY